MQGLITLDFGNSNPHAGIFSKNENEWNLLKVVPLNELALYANQFGLAPHNSSMVLCEVKSYQDELNPFIEQGYLVTRVKEYWRGKRFAGMPVDYSETLGEDRLIEAFYLYKKNNQNVLNINAGTFVTMDVISKDGFKGGYILPGIKTYFETFKKGEQLKDISLSNVSDGKLPHDTKEAMQGGYLAFAALAKELIQAEKIEKIVLSGGNLAEWANVLGHNSPIPVVEQNPHLVHFALQYWMTTQIELL